MDEAEIRQQILERGLAQTAVDPHAKLLRERVPAMDAALARADERRKRERALLRLRNLAG